MSGKGTNLVYWDTCIFYALFKKENGHGTGILEGIIDTYNQLQNSQITVVTSTITIAEVAAGNFADPNVFTQFKDLRFAPNFSFTEASFPIMELASELKDYYYNNPLGADGQYKLLGLGDAIHIATAIKRGIPELTTFDGNHKKSKGEIGMLKLSSPLAGKYELQIKKPVPPMQGKLSLAGL